jgi:hypothetical protein
MMKNFNALSEREILALALSLEEEDERVYADLPKASSRIFLHRLRYLMPCAATNRATVEDSSSCIGRSLASTFR